MVINFIAQHTLDEAHERMRQQVRTRATRVYGFIDTPILEVAAIGADDVTGVPLAYSGHRIARLLRGVVVNLRGEDGS